jgi:hypothetical protein
LFLKVRRHALHRSLPGGVERLSPHRRGDGAHRPGVILAGDGGVLRLCLARPAADGEGLGPGAHTPWPGGSLAGSDGGRPRRSLLLQPRFPSFGFALLAVCGFDRGDDQD